MLQVDKTMNHLFTTGLDDTIYLVMIHHHNIKGKRGAAAQENPVHDDEKGGQRYGQYEIPATPHLFFKSLNANLPQLHSRNLRPVRAIKTSSRVLPRNLISPW